MQRLLLLADVLATPRAVFAEARRSGAGLGALLVWLAIEALLVHPVSVASQVLRVTQSPAAALVGLWSTYLAYALSPLLGVGAVALAIWLMVRLTRRSHLELWTIVSLVGLAYAPHVWLTATGAALAGAGLDLPFLPHDSDHLSPPLAILRLALAFGPSLMLVVLFGLPNASRDAGASSGEALAASDSTSPPPRRRAVRLAALAVVCLGLVSSGGRIGRDYERARPVYAGDRVGAFTLTRLAGGRATSAELLGPASLIDFWATWCTPCVATMPILERLHRELAPRGLRLVSVNVEAPDAKVVHDFVRRHGLTFPVYQDDGSLQRSLKVTSYPTAVLVDGAGVVRQVYVGVTPYETLRADIVALLQR